jgi:hypothetical protein
MRKFALFAMVVVLLSPLVVAAQAGNPCTSGTSSSNDLGRCVSQIYVWSLGLSGLLAVGAAVFGGYIIMTARGNGAQVGKGKQYLVSALAGMVLLMGAYLILNTINSDLTDFRIDFSNLQSAREKQQSGNQTQP